MKTTVTIEQHICDFCKENDAYKWNACLRCGKDICYDCAKTEAKEYSHGVYFSGSGDGRYCNECDTILTETRADPLHNAYKVIKTLRAEQEVWYKDFKQRSDAAENRIKELQK